MNLTREEQETIIRGSAADQTWEVSTADPRIIRLMQRQGYKPNIRKKPSAEYVFYTVPFNRVRILKLEKRMTGFALKRAEKSGESHSGVMQTDQNSPDIV